MTPQYIAVGPDEEIEIDDEGNPLAGRTLRVTAEGSMLILASMDGPRVTAFLGLPLVNGDALTLGIARVCGEIKRLRRKGPA